MSDVRERHRSFLGLRWLVAAAIVAGVAAFAYAAAPVGQSLLINV